MIREATLADVPQLVTMAEAFVGSTEYRALMPFRVDRIALMAEALILEPNGVVLVADAGGVLVGMMALQAFTHPMTGLYTVAEHVWWVSPSHRGTAGVRLLKAAEAWAKAQEADVLQMIAPNARVGNLYKRAGFVPVEQLFQRSVR